MYFLRLLNSILVLVTVISNVEGVLWRILDEEIPHDAVVGGHDPDGNKYYIGEILFNVDKRSFQVDSDSTMKLLPGKIIPKTLTIHVVWDNTQYQSSDRAYKIEILCSCCHNRFKWIPVNEPIDKEEMVPVAEDIDDHDNMYYIGRIASGDALHVGAIYGDNNFYYAYGGRVHHKTESYEVLTYKA